MGYNRISYLAILLFCFSSYANFEFSPIESKIQTEGQNSSLMAKIKSSVDKEVPVVIKVMERTLGEDGKEIRTATTDLQVFPQQFILPGKTERMIKVLWKGPKQLDHEKAYRLLVENAPVDLTKEQVGKASIKIQINYAAMVYVSSKPGIANVSISAVSKDKSGKKLAIALENSGDAHLIIAKPEVDLSCEGKEDKIVLAGEKIKNLEGLNLLAKSKMNASISVPNELSKCSNFKWAFRYKND
jgi:P pilus assembly chaperone PapD